MKPIIIIVIAVVLFIPIAAFADDFQIETECNSGDITIYVKNQEDNLVSNVKIMTIKGVTGTSGYEDKFFTNEKGQVEILRSENTGYVWLQKGKFNDQKFKVGICSLNEIPPWIKTNAQWWIEGEIDEDSFIQGIQFLVKNNIIKIPKVSDNEMETASYDKTQRIPTWVASNVEWWVNGSINDDSFLQGMQFLVINRIIDVGEKKDPNNLANDSNLPTIGTLKKIGVDADWKTSVSSSPECSSKVGIESNRQLSAVKSTLNPRTGEHENFSAVIAEICKFDKMSNSQRAWTGSTSTDEELFQDSTFVGTSKISGDCFMEPPKYFKGISLANGGCTYGAYKIGVSITSTENLDFEWTSKVIIALMDEMLENVNQIKNTGNEISFKEIIHLDELSKSLSSENIFTENDFSSNDSYKRTECPSDYPYLWDDGNCWNLPQDSEIKLECSQNFPYLWSDGSCYNVPECTSQYSYRWSDGQCYNLPECSGEFQYRWNDNQCYNAPECSGEFQYRWSDNQCYNAPECSGEFQYRWSDNQCYNLQECSGEYNFRWSDGNCYNVRECTSDKPYRWSDNSCYNLPECTPSYPHRWSDGQCYNQPPPPKCNTGAYDTGYGYCCSDDSYTTGDGMCHPIQSCPDGYYEVTNGCCPVGTYDPGDGTCRYP